MSQVQIEADTDITGHVTAPTMRIGNDQQYIRIEDMHIDSDGNMGGVSK